MLKLFDCADEVCDAEDGVLIVAIRRNRIILCCELQLLEIDQLALETP